MNDQPQHTVRGAPALLLLSAGLVAIAFWSGRLGSRQWSVALLVFVALATGVAGGILFAKLWRAGGRVDDASDLALLRRLTGAAGALLVFLGCAGFAAVEAHAIGSGLGAGAPAATVALLGPPLVVGAVALRRALRGAGSVGHDESADEDSVKSGASDDAKDDQNREA